MELYDSGIRLIQALQALGGWLTAPMQFFSFLGSEQFFLVIAPAIYWCVDASLGIRLGLFLLISSNLHLTFKLVGHAPRPYWYDPGVRAFAAESTFGIPSGHSQTAVVVWETLAARIRRNWAWWGAILVIFLIGVSRLYLAVHFPTDVIAGWAIGAALLWVLSAVWKSTAGWAKALPLWQQIAAGLGFSILLVLAAILARAALGSWQVPAEWIENAQHAFPEGEPIDPLALSNTFTSAGTIFGMLAGLALIHQRGGFQPDGEPWQKLARFALGLAGMLAIYLGLGAVFPRGEYLLAYLLRFLRYGLLGLWVVWLAPLVFYRLGLAKRGG
jgi:membrane-associated phospholipid phosphatase